VFFHVLQVVDHMGVMRNAVLNVNIEKVFQSYAGKLIALETPRYILPGGAAPEPVSAFYAMRHYCVREAAVAANFFNGNTGPAGSLLQFFGIVFPGGEITRAYPAIQPADSGYLSCILFHECPLKNNLPYMDEQIIKRTGF
jgi:hypothetical protein